MKKILFLCSVLSVVFFYSAAYCTYTGETPETEAPSSGNSLFTKYEDDLLSVDIKDVSLGEVLQKLSEETGIIFSFPPELGEEKVMVRFSDFKIADALNKILDSHDRIFIYEEGEPDSEELLPSTLKEVRIYTPLAAGTKKGGTSDLPTVINSNNSKQTQANKNNPVQKKSEATRSSRRTGKKQTVTALADDLKDSDYKVRLESVRNLRSIGNADAIGHLTSALEDKNPAVREAALGALGELQEESTDNTETADDQPLEGGPAPVIDYSVSGDAGNITVDLNLSEVQEPLITAGFWIEYDPSQMSISAEIKDGDGAWDSGMSNKVMDPKGPGTYLITTGNLSTVSPDDSNTIGVASLQGQCLTGNCSGQQIKVHTVPGFDSVVGNGASVYDSDIKEVIITIP